MVTYLRTVNAVNASSPSLQEMGKSLESGNICEMTCPSLQDLLWQELDSNSLLSRKKSALTRPSLQDFEGDVSCPVVFAEVGYVSHIPDVGPYIVADVRQLEIPEKIVDAGYASKEKEESEDKVREWKEGEARFRLMGALLY